jgi:hypothetical protein
MVSIESCLESIKSDAGKWLNSNRIVSLCRDHGYFPEADGALPPARLIELFMRQIAAGNVPCEAVRMMGEGQFIASGYCQARMRLPLAVIESTARQACRALNEAVDAEAAHRWHGHRVLLIDATGFSMPDEPQLQAHFGQPGCQKPGCGFPVAHLLLLFNARTGLAVDALTAPLRTHEASLAADVHRGLSAGDLVVGDDSFGSYALFAVLNQQKAFGLFPLHHQRIRDFTPHRDFTSPGARKKKERAAFAVDQVAGNRRSAGGMAQAPRQAQMDGRPAVEADSTVAGRSRDSPHNLSSRLPADHADDRDHAAGPD